MARCASHSGRFLCFCRDRGAPRSESIITMIAGGNHTLIHCPRRSFLRAIRESPLQNFQKSRHSERRRSRSRRIFAVFVCTADRWCEDPSTRSVFSKVCLPPASIAVERFAALCNTLRMTVVLLRSHPSEGRSRSMGYKRPARLGSIFSQLPPSFCKNC